MKARATNLSEGGMAIHLESALTKKSGLKVRFALPETKITMEPKAEIAWADGLGRAGIKFVDVPESSREQLERWILRRMEKATRA